MAIVHGDWSINRTTGNIRYIGGNHATSPTYATVIELHRWLMDLSDDSTPANADDELDITELLPSSRSTDNIVKLLGNYNIDDTSSEHIYDGSIIQGAVGVDQIIYDGIVNFGNAGIVIQIIQDGAVITTDWWNSNSGLNADAAQGISHRFMIKTHDYAVDGGDIDGRRLIGTARTFGNTYAEFSINGTSRGNNVFALVDANDVNNGTVEGTVSGWTGISNTTEGYAGVDISGDGADEFYYSEWNTNQPTRSINEFYERMKWLTRDGSVSTLYGLNGELFRGITHEVVVDTPTGTFSASEALSWGTGATAGTAQLLAINSTTAATKLWMQLLTGVIPTDGETMTGGTSSATVDMNVTITERTISKPFIGASTGSALIGAYGVGMEPADTTASETFFDLDNAQVVPPNNVSFAVSGVVSGEDRILVAPWDGTTSDSEGNPAIEKDQLQTDGSAYASATTTAITMSAAVPTDTPASGDVRILMTSGIYREIPYSSYSGAVFTVPSIDLSGDPIASTAQNAWIAYIDKIAGATSESFTGVYLADRDLVVIVRDGGGSPIKQFISSAQLTNTGGSITAIRTSDA